MNIIEGGVLDPYRRIPIVETSLCSFPRESLSSFPKSEQAYKVMAPSDQFGYDAPATHVVQT